ncbi:LAGLIDADG endonuclease (mitochondrion) protein [Rutstroemia sp. NJR-2017a WRK4]|nr:LAGLIDADG endonuclease (mitochondrion) protein [Rutstroemia sp. NJR-2017a WRK4]
MLYLPTLISVIEVLLVTVPVLLTVAYVTVAERKTMASMQRRLGPNAVDALYKNRKAPIKPFKENVVSVCKDLLSSTALSTFFNDFKGKGGIYMFTFKNNPNIFYIGRAKNFQKRFKSHLNIKLIDRFHTFANTIDYFDVDYRSILNHLDTKLATIKGGKLVLLFSHELTKAEKESLLNNVQNAVNETVSVWVYKKVNNKFILLNNNKPTYISKLEASKQLNMSTKTIKLIKFFEKYPLISLKREDYLLFKQIVSIMQLKEHITLEGLQKIVNLRATLNFGLSKELQLMFPETIPHKNDEVLLTAIKEYFNCGYCYLRKQENTIDFKVTKFSDVNDIIIPFFINNPILGVKSLDFKD